MKDTQLCSAVLQVEPPFAVSGVDCDADAQRIDVWVAESASQERRFFGRGSAPRAGGEVAVWRHLNVGRFKCFVHAPVGELPADLRSPWVGRSGSPFTRALERFIVELFTEGLGLTAVCRTLDLDASDIWRLKRSLQSGQSRQAGGAAAGPSTLPDVTHPQWMRLVNGELDVDINPLSLRLLIRRLRVQLRGIPNPQQQLSKLEELRRFFLKYQQSLSPELIGIFH